MNLDLLRLLCGYDKKTLMSAMGVDKLFELDKLSSRYTLVGERLHRVYKDTTKEVPAVRHRSAIVRDLHEASGHTGITKVYHMARVYYYWPGLFETCVEIVDSCVSCKTTKGKMRSMPLKPTKKFG